jgi:hypothetical protein
MYEMAAAGEDDDYDHRRLTTIYSDHDLPEHDGSDQPATRPPF